MADKHIIDGCNVSWCPYYHGHDVCKNTCHYFGTPCELVDVQNCDYKTLNKLKAERDSYIDKYFLESQKVLSLRKVLKEIKEIAQGYEDTYNQECKQLCCTEILQKISEAEE